MHSRYPTDHPPMHSMVPPPWKALHSTHVKPGGLAWSKAENISIYMKKFNLIRNQANQQRHQIH